ncbi:MAG: MarR family transcriptional regulator [Roseibium sp.]|uniref:MarR family winged helix-turn-helix transcriptional regulator n=1 Tax=Roseibium sp. TaxID=1936156 RepID=UPI0026318FCC|nr:MarR family transcriptional regulator [Roseibium sp.]MCV0425602.1 MarR family transcriptional regulator [Roseibium sp.]
MSEDFTLHNRIGFKVTRLARIMEARLEKQLSEHGITRLMWCVLRGVGMENVTTPSELADYICIARPAVSRLLKTMEERGLLERINVNDDKRFTEVALTKLGVSKMKACHVLVRELNEHFSGKLDDRTYQMFMDVVDRLAEDEQVQLMRL